MLICENINSMNRMDINTDIPFLFLSKLSELMNKPKKPVWYVSEEEDFYKHLVNLYKYYCSFLDDVDMHFTLFGKVTKILDYRASNKKKLQEARESNIVYFKNVLLKQLPNKYLNSNHIVNFKADLGNPLAFRHLVNLLEDIVKDKTNPNRVDEVKFLILHINKYLSVLVYTQPGFYMYKVFLLKLKENLLKYIDGEQIFPLGDVRQIK